MAKKVPAPVAIMMGGIKSKPSEIVVGGKSYKTEDFRSITVDFKVTGNGEVEGWANVKIMDRYQELILPESFAESLPDFMKNPCFLFGHNYNITEGGFIPIIGSVTELTIKDIGLYFKALFAKTTFAQEVYSLFLDGHLRTFSVGFIPTEWRNPTQDELTKYGIDLQRTITKAILLEISAVPIPGNQASLATAVRSFTQKDIENFEGFTEWLKAFKVEMAAKAAPVGEPAKPTAKLAIDEAQVMKCRDLMHQTLCSHVEAFNQLLSALESSGGGQENQDEGGDNAGQNDQGQGGKGFTEIEVKSLLDAIENIPEKK
jgi:HK97 family phage prohead protease